MTTVAQRCSWVQQRTPLSPLSPSPTDTGQELYVHMYRVSSSLVPRREAVNLSAGLFHWKSAPIDGSAPNAPPHACLSVKTTKG